MDSTPGGSMEEKAAALSARMPAVLLDMLTGEIENLATVGAVGADDVEAFFSNGFGRSLKQPAGGKENRGGGNKKR